METGRHRVLHLGRVSAPVDFEVVFGDYFVAKLGVTYVSDMPGVDLLLDATKVLELIHFGE